MFTPGTGGLYKHAEDLVLELKKLGHDVVVVTRASTFVPRNSEFMFRNEEKEVSSFKNIEIRHLVYPRGFRWVKWLVVKLIHRNFFQNFALRLHRLLATRSATRCLKDRDIVHHVGQSCALVGYAAENASETLGLPFVVQPTVHPGQAGDSPLDIKLFRKAHGLFVHTEFEKNYFISTIQHPRVTVVGNGIEDRSNGVASRFRDAHRITGPMVLYIGRKEANKGYDLVVEAWRFASQRIPSLNLVCIGPPSGSGSPQAEPSFHDLQFCDEDTKHDALAACDTLCVPSEGESFGLVFMEAGRYRKPVIARRLPVLKELLGDEAAQLVGREISYNRVDATADEVATGMVDVLTNPARSQAMGERLFEISSTHVWARTVRKFENAYRLHLPDPAGPPLLHRE